MTCVCYVCLGALLLMSSLAMAAEQQPPEFAALFHVAFDGTAAPDVPNAGVAVAGAETLKYVEEGRLGKAANFVERGCVEYRGIPPINPQSGAIELWVKAAHPRQEMEDHCYLQMLKGDKSAGVEIKFTHVEMSYEVAMWGRGKKHRRYGWTFAQDKWMQIVVTWETADPDVSGLRLYTNGHETGYPTAYQAIEAPEMLRVGCKSPEEGFFAKAAIDEVCIYNRSLSASQVKALYESGNAPLPQKVASLRERIKRDDAVQAERRDKLFNSKLGIIHGRNTSLLNWPDSAYVPLRIPVPTPIHETELEKTDLSQYAVLIVPGGGGLNLTEPNKEALLRYVREGGGYVGICGGGVSAHKAGLIEAESYQFGAQGSVFVKIKPHPVTEGCMLTELLFPHAKGPLWVAKEVPDQEVIIVFKVGNPPLPTFAHTIVRKLGKGRVVAFSGHPESSAETRNFFRNAVLWAAKIIGQPPDTPPKTTATR